jgi:hypothetical protein
VDPPQKYTGHHWSDKWAQNAAELTEENVELCVKAVIHMWNEYGDDYAGAFGGQMVVNVATLEDALANSVDFTDMHDKDSFKPYATFKALKKQMYELIGQLEACRETMVGMYESMYQLNTMHRLMKNDTAVHADPLHLKLIEQVWKKMGAEIYG